MTVMALCRVEGGCPIPDATAKKAAIAELRKHASDQQSAYHRRLAYESSRCLKQQADAEPSTECSRQAAEHSQHNKSASTQLRFEALVRAYQAEQFGEGLRTAIAAHPGLSPTSLLGDINFNQGKISLDPCVELFFASPDDDSIVTAARFHDQLQGSYQKRAQKPYRLIIRHARADTSQTHQHLAGNAFCVLDQDQMSTEEDTDLVEQAVFVFEGTASQKQLHHAFGTEQTKEAEASLQIAWQVKNSDDFYRGHKPEATMSLNLRIYSTSKKFDPKVSCIIVATR